MRIARGLSAMCLLVIFMVIAYDVLVIRPFSDQSLIPTARYVGPVDSIPLFFLTQLPWSVSLVSVLI